jgi:hypothetical protein
MRFIEYISQLAQSAKLYTRTNRDSGWIEATHTVYQTNEDGEEIAQSEILVFDRCIRIDDIVYIVRTTDDTTTSVYLRNGTALNVNKSYESIKKRLPR